MNLTLTPNDVEGIIKQNQIFNNIVLVSKPQVIKVSPKSDMSIIWIDIWDVQSGSKAKSLINRCFNVERFITTIWEANMNPGISQYKNCWWWEHATMSCYIQGSRCVKYNGPHILRSKKVDLIYFIFIFIFYFLFNLFFYFSIFRTTRVRVDQLCHHISHLMV